MHDEEDGFDEKDEHGEHGDDDVEACYAEGVLVSGWLYLELRVRRWRIEVGGGR